MARTAPTSRPPVLPSSAQAALALAIVRSKPRDMTIHDYVLQLREHIRSEQPALGVAQHHDYLDQVSYWQKRCQNAEDECDRLRSINAKLERSNHVLSQQTSHSVDEGPITTSSSPKRKAQSSATRPSRRKNAKAVPSADVLLTHTQEGIESDYNFFEKFGNDGSALMVALYTTHNLCRSTALDTEALCLNLARTASALAKFIHLVANDHDALSRQGSSTSGSRSLGEDKSDFSYALIVSARVFMSILVGMGRVKDVAHDTQQLSIIVYELAELFQTTLLSIEASAQKTADATLLALRQPKKGKAKTPALVKESAAARSLAHFLIGLLGLLDKGNVLHQKLFDAFVFLLLDRVGRNLHWCTFSRHRSANDDSHFISPEPSGSPGTDTKALSIRLEAKALILILERVMGLAPHHMNAYATKPAKIPDRIGRTLSMKTLPAAPKSRLSAIAKDRLQRTLVSCMYGDKVDDEFLDVLTKPMPSMRVGSLQNVSKIDDENVEEWFKGEVWRLVGWDILSREGGW